MKLRSIALLGIFFLSTAATLTAGEVVIYGGTQKPGKVDFTSAEKALNNLNVFNDEFTGDFGGTFGARFSAGRIIGFEQSIGFSPRFAKSGVKAFQMDSNLLVQAPGNIVPYATAGIGFIHSWGQDVDLSDLPQSNAEEVIEDVAKFAFSFGTNFAFNYGGGIKVRRLAGPLGLNIDFRGYTLPGIRDGNLNFIQTTAGLVISW